jgi:CheY-like chemotaxis protein
MTQEEKMPVKNILVVDDSPTERYFAVDLLTGGLSGGHA